jgi:hypothetical protein
MTKPILIMTLTMGTLLAFTLGKAQAQFPPTRGVPPSYNFPTYSPYLNLNRTGGTAAQNYFGLVRPELDFRQGLQNLNQQATYNQQLIADLGNQPQLATGHRIFFNNTSHFFGNLQGPGTGTGAGAGRAGAGQRGTAGAAANRNGQAAGGLSR